MKHNIEKKGLFDSIPLEVCYVILFTIMAITIFILLSDVSGLNKRVKNLENHIELNVSQIEAGHSVKQRAIRETISQVPIETISTEEATKYGKILFDKTKLKDFGYDYEECIKVDNGRTLLWCTVKPVKSKIHTGEYDRLPMNYELFVPITDEIYKVHDEYFKPGEKEEMWLYQELLQRNFKNLKEVVKGKANIDPPFSYNSDRKCCKEYSKDYKDPVYQDENIAIFKWKEKKDFGPAYKPY